MQLEVYGAAVYLPVAEARRVGSASSPHFRRHVGLLLCLAAGFRFRKRTPGGGAQDLRGLHRRWCDVLDLVGVGHRNIELKAI